MTYTKEQHQKFLCKLGYKKPKKLGLEEYWNGSFRNKYPFETRTLASVSNNIPATGFKSGVDDYKWKNRFESTEAIIEIEKKKTRLAPAYNKGAVQYISDGADLTTLGKKI